MDRRAFLRALGGLGALGALGTQNIAAALRTGEPASLVRIRSGSRISELASSFDLTEHARDGWVDAVLWPGDRARLERRGFRFEVLDPDPAATDLRARIAEARAQVADPGQRLTYRTLAEFEADMRALAAQRPDLVRLLELPFTTIEGRRVYGVEIAGPDVTLAAADGRPTAMLDGLHHAREWPSAELPMMFAQDLVASYGEGDPEIIDILDAVRVIIVPVVNPDGFVRSRETVSDFLAPLPGAAALLGEFAYHRKTMRSNSGLPAEIAQGVDANRNYPFHWGGIGASGSPTGQTYRGPEPASEPCVQNVRWLGTTNHVLVYVTNHTYSDLVLRPWGHTDLDAPDERALRALGDAMADINGYHSQKGIQLYPTTGTAEDWMYGATGGFGYTFEIGSRGSGGLGNTTPIEGAGFHPQYNLHIRPFYDRNRGAFLRSLQAARDTTLHGVITGLAPPGSTITTRKTIYQPIDFGDLTMPLEQMTSIGVGETGSFTWHVNPSAAPETVAAVDRGDRPKEALEPYEIEAVHPDGTTRRVTRVVRRGSSHQIDLR